MFRVQDVTWNKGLKKGFLAESNKR